MNRIRRLLILLTLFGWNVAASQNVQYLHTVLIGSNGDNRVKTGGGEGALEDLHKYFLDSFQGRLKTKTILQLSKKQQGSIGDAVGRVYASSDSADLVVLVWAGPWQRDDRAVERSSFISLHNETLPAEYILNFVQFIPAQSVLAFILSPLSHEFPPEVLTEFQPSTASGGRHIILIRPTVRMDFDDVVDAFTDAVKAMRSAQEIDTNKDGWVRFSEWIREFYKKAQQEKLALAGFAVAKFPDYRLVQVKQ